MVTVVLLVSSGQAAGILVSELTGFSLSRKVLVTILTLNSNKSPTTHAVAVVPSERLMDAGQQRAQVGLVAQLGPSLGVLDPSRSMHLNQERVETPGRPRGPLWSPPAL